MNIILDYQLKSFNSRANNQQIQTNPSFGMKKQIVDTSAKVVAQLIPATTVLAVQNGKAKKIEQTSAAQQKEVKQEIPTREEFKQMLEKDGVINDWMIDNWLDEYDNNPQNTIEYYNMTDKTGDRLAKELYISSSAEIIKHPKLFKKIIDTENDFGIQQFKCNDVECFPDNVHNYLNGLETMLNMKDKNGSLRFQKPDDYVAAEVFEKYPNMAMAYADAKDDIGNYRFTGQAIYNIINAKTGGEYPTDKIDEIMNLKRPDGTYVYNDFPKYQVDTFMGEEDSFKKLVTLRVPGENNYLSEHEISSLMTPFRCFPKETIQLLQMSAIGTKKPRFSTLDISKVSLEACYCFQKAPISFNALANIRNREGDLALTLKGICDIIKSLELASNEQENNIHIVKEKIKMVGTLAKVQYMSEGGNARYDMDTDQIIEATKTYKEYPKETVEIISNYKGKRSFLRKEAVIPSKEDIKLYIENITEFDKKYQKNIEKI